MRLYMMAILCLVLASCSTSIDDNANNDYAEYNQKIIEYLQQKYDVKADVEFAPNYRQRLSKEEVESYESFYRFIGGLKEKPMEMTMASSKSEAATRGMNTVFFEQNVSYEKDGIVVGVYYDIDTYGKITDDSNRIIAGLGGEGVSQNYNSAYYKIESYRSDLRVSGNRIIADALRGDYIVTFYHSMQLKYDFVDSVWKYVPSDQSVVSSRQRIRLACTGTLDTTTNNGDFTVFYAGPGSWFRDEIENPE